MGTRDPRIDAYIDKSAAEAGRPAEEGGPRRDPPAWLAEGKPRNRKYL